MDLTFYCPHCNYKYEQNVYCLNCHQPLYPVPLDPTAKELSRNAISALTVLGVNVYNDLHGVKMLSYTDSPYLVQIEVCTMFVNSSAGNVSIILPLNVEEAGKSFTIKKISSDVNTVTISTEGGTTTIDGVATYQIKKQYNCVVVQHDTNKWFITGEILK